MRKLIILLLLLVHTAASSGMVLSLHYCMGSLASLRLGHHEEDGCDNCGMKNSSCCHDDVKVLKISDPQFLIHHSTEITFTDHALLDSASDWDAILPGSYHTPYNGPFVVTYNGPPIFLLNCNFRI